MSGVGPSWLGLGATSFPLGFPYTVLLLKMNVIPNSFLVCGKQVKCSQMLSSSHWDLQQMLVSQLRDQSINVHGDMYFKYFV